MFSVGNRFALALYALSFQGDFAACWNVCRTAWLRRLPGSSTCPFQLLWLAVFRRCSSASPPGPGAAGDERTTREAVDVVDVLNGQAHFLAQHRPQPLQFYLIALPPVFSALDFFSV
jgi:hypothetical protein